jgi:hypothetical protein
MPMSNGRTGERDLLDRVLEGKPDEVKARVLEMVYRLGIDPRDELFLVMIALGQLQILLEDAPQAWEGVFASFSAELEAWTESNIQMLEAIAKQAEAGEGIADTTKELVISLSGFTKLLSEQSRTSPNYGRELESLKGRFEDLRNALDYRLTSLSESLEQQKLAGKGNSLVGSGADNTNGIKNIWLVVLLAVGVGFFTLWQGQQKNAQTLEWLLYKANRQECLQKLVPSTSPQCLSFKKLKN